MEKLDLGGNPFEIETQHIFCDTYQAVDIAYTDFYFQLFEYTIAYRFLLSVFPRYGGYFVSGNEKLSCKCIFVSKHPKKPEDFYEKYFSDFRIFTAKHDMKRKNSKILDIKVYYNGIEWPVEKIKYDECEECHYPIVALDTHRGETVCECCGRVENTAHLTDDRELLIQRGIITDENAENTAKHAVKLSKFGQHIKKLINSGYYYESITEQQPYLNEQDRLCWIDNKKKMWRKSQYALFVDIVSSNYMMTSYQKQRAKDVIDRYSLSQIHSRINHNAIITGICIYFMKKDGRHVLIKNSPFCKEVGLSTNSYAVIRKNLDILLS